VGGYNLLPAAAIAVGLGLLAMFQQQSQAVPGAGIVGQADALAATRAQQTERYAVACFNAAEASPGLVSSSIVVNPSIVNGATVAAPSGAGCMSTSAGGGTRNVYGYSTGVPGEAAQVVSDSGQSAAWLRVTSAGQATSLVSGSTIAVPASIGVGSLVNAVQVNP